MRKITAVATCTALAVALAACGEKPKPATNQVSSQQRAQIDKARATLADQRATLEADQTALAARKANAVADIKKTRDKLKAQAKDLRGTVSDLKSRVHGLQRQARSERATLRQLENKASGVRYLVRHSTIPGTGTFLVNKEITPGMYRASASPGCYWERQADLRGDIDSIAANDNADGPVIVAISSADVAFKAARCGTFHKIG